MRAQSRGKSSRGRRDDRRETEMNKTKFTRRNSTKQQRRDKEIADTAIEMSRSNPYSWYAKFPQYIKDAGTLPFGQPLGERLTGGVYVPGIMRIHYVPGIGLSKDLMSPINRSAIRFYTYMRSMQKAAATYDSADVMMYLMALDSCYAFHSMLRRAYGVAQLFSPVNKYYPIQLLKYMGFDESILNNLAEFRAYINRFALSLGSYTCPANFDIMARHQWMCEGLYTDSETTRAQTYVFVPEGFWQFNNTVTTGSQLDFVRWNETDNSTTLHSLQQIQALGDSLLSHILNDEDTGRISGDMYNAFSPNNNKKVQETPDGFMVLPVYDKVVLSQIENATICGLPDFDSLHITQNPSVNSGAILFDPKFKLVRSVALGFTGNAEQQDLTYKIRNLYMPSYADSDFTFINMHWDNPTPEDVVEATRLHALLQPKYSLIPSLGDVETTVEQGPSPYEPKYLASLASAPADIVTRVTVAVFANEFQTKSVNVYNNYIYTAVNQWVVNNPKAKPIYRELYDGSKWGYNWQEQNVLGYDSMVTRMTGIALMNTFDWAPLLVIAELYQSTVDSGGVTVPFPSMRKTYFASDVDNVVGLSVEKAKLLNDAAMLSLFDVPQMGW